MKGFFFKIYIFLKKKYKHIHTISFLVKVNRPPSTLNSFCTCCLLAPTSFYFLLLVLSLIPLPSWKLLAFLPSVPHSASQNDGLDVNQVQVLLIQNCLKLQWQWTRGLPTILHWCSYCSVPAVRWSQLRHLATSSLLQWSQCPPIRWSLFLTFTAGKANGEANRRLPAITWLWDAAATPS